MENSNRIKILVNLYKQNKITTEELEELRSYFYKLEYRMLYEKELLESLFHEEEHNQHNSKKLFKKDLDLVLARINKTKPETIFRQTNRYSFLLRVASVLLLGFVAAFVAKRYYDANLEISKHTSIISPGANEAYLTLENGKTIELKDIEEGIIIGQEQISYQNGEQIALTKNEENPNIPQQLVLTIPKKGKYKVTLSDGTIVWLNSATTLKYPSYFKDKVRNVELDGEGFFEVSKSLNKDSKFTVTTNNQKVSVYGTQFNVQAYAEENQTVTSLYEGAVKVTPNLLHISQNVEVDLKPGQESINNSENKKIRVRSFNHAEMVGWKEGYFSLNGQKLTAIMRQIARWYDVEIKYKNQLRFDMTLGGSISQSRDLQSVLSAIEKTGQVSFKIEGRTVIVE